jgi:hypothetical protein
MGQASNEWENPLNWSDSTVPGAADDVKIPGAFNFSDLTIAAGTNASVKSTTIDPVQSNSMTLTIDGSLSVGSAFVLATAQTVKGSGYLEITGRDSEWRAGNLGENGDLNVYLIGTLVVEANASTLAVKRLEVGRDHGGQKLPGLLEWGATGDNKLTANVNFGSTTVVYVSPLGTAKFQNDADGTSQKGGITGGGPDAGWINVGTVSFYQKTPSPATMTFSTHFFNQGDVYFGDLASDDATGDTNFTYAKQGEQGQDESFYNDTIGSVSFNKSAAITCAQPFAMTGGSLTVFGDSNRVKGDFVQSDGILTIRSLAGGNYLTFGVNKYVMKGGAIVLAVSGTSNVSDKIRATDFVFQDDSGASRYLTVAIRGDVEGTRTWDVIELDNGVRKPEDSSRGFTKVIKSANTVTSGQWVSNNKIYRLVDLQDVAWNDSNRNGIYEASESGLSNVTVNLLDSNNDLVATAVTDPNGRYAFDDDLNLSAGTYRMQIIAPAGSGMRLTLQNQGSDETIDSDADPLTGYTAPFTLEAGDVPTEIGAGFVPDQAPFASPDVATTAQDTPVVIHVLANDSDLDGDPLTVTLTVLPQYGTAVVNDNGTPADPTDDFVTYTPNPGYTGQDSFTYQIDDGHGGTATALVTVTVGAPGTGGGPLGGPGGGSGTASVGDRVWLDLNGDGIQDTNESGLAGVMVRLRDAQGVIVATAITDSNGLYLFGNLVSGSYQLEFVAPPGYAFSLKSQGTDASLDSDADPSTGRTDLFFLSDGQLRTDLDAGLHAV